ncbi:glycosyltransferase family 2 protein [Candidatus Poribacteria bacterium]|nr:glycosyltransferase family 2 protein [Candidatus Poribacteria bacterium]MYG05679.1 glycosyltransferase family 2 protein [Candidatus Poribacteria bacterium]MYK23743.1 glycosyltransferase family 2 protein [Candidatus Poribacteria bacterium]
MKNQSIEVSVVMPCLNEQETLGTCIEKAQRALNTLGVQGEVVVADNGSTDESVAIAECFGVRVVHQPLRGYGAAYLAGFAAAQGKFIVMGDADDTYDFTDLGRFIIPLHEGFDLVMGNRFKREMLPGAMPWARRYIGNPILSGILRWLFGTSISDSHCGMRSFTEEAYTRMALQTTGMEFASEMVIKAVQANLKILEIPINYYHRAGESKLKPIRDAARHIHFMLKYKISDKI